MEYVKYESVKDDFISIAWYVGSTCNYSCSYCIPDFYDGKKKFPPYEPFLDFADRVQEKYPDKRILLTLYGGEVTLWKKFEEFLDLCKSKSIEVRIVSNGSRSISWWKRVAPKLNYTVISYHTEFATEEHIIEVMKTLTNKGGHLNLMVKHDAFDSTIEIGKRISEECKVMVVPRFLRVNFTTELYPYTEDQLKLFKRTPLGNRYLDQGEYRYYGMMVKTETGAVRRFPNVRHIFFNKLNRWKGWKCWGGIDSFFVDYDGNIYVGQCRRGKFGVLGEDYNIPNEPFICDKDICNCTQDMLEAKKEKV